ncbi:hypothetical protein ACN1NX_001224 [Listeria monocytogenes]
MIRINDLWNREELLIKNGIHFSDGSGVEVEISYYPIPDIKKGHYFSFLDVYKEDQENMTKIDVFKEIKLSNGFYCCVVLVRGVMVRKDLLLILMSVKIYFGFYTRKLPIHL